MLGKLGSYAGLLYAADTANPEYAKFYGDIQEKITAITTDLIFFELEINKIDDAVLERALKVPALARYKPWLDDLRKEKPYQLEEKLERVFHEKSVTSRSSWNRLFNETMTALQFEVEGEKEPLPLEPTLNLLLNPDEGRRRAAAEALANVFKSNLRLFTLITNTLAKDKEISDRWRGFKDVADSRHLANRVEREVVEALVEAVRAAYPATSHRYYAMKAQVAWQEEARLLGSQRAAAGQAGAGGAVGCRRGHGARRLCGVRAAHGEHRQALLRGRLDRRAGARRQITRGVLAPDGAVRAPLYPHELPGPVARRDDPGA